MVTICDIAISLRHWRHRGVSAIRSSTICDIAATRHRDSAGLNTITLRYRCDNVAQKCVRCLKICYMRYRCGKGQGIGGLNTILRYRCDNKATIVIARVDSKGTCPLKDSDIAAITAITLR